MSILDAIAAERGPLFIVGSSKNSGKTTFLNHLNKELAARLAHPVGILTIGRDGEPEDAVWHHTKPPVTLLPGNLFVTVEAELARLAKEAELVEALPFATMLGPLVIGRAGVKVKAEIVGPDTNRQLWQIVARLEEHRCGHQLIDGAFERRTQVASHDGARLILVVSPDIAGTPEGAGRWLARQLDLFGLPKPPEGFPAPPDAAPLGLYWWHGDQWTTEPAKGAPVYCKGPLTDSLVDRHLKDLRDREILIEDPTKFFLDDLRWKRLQRRLRGFYVQRQLRLLMAAVNPFGLMRRFKAPTFFDAIAKACPDLPLMDVVAGLEQK